MVPQGLLQVGWQLALLVAAVELDLDGVAAILEAVAVPAVLGCNLIDILEKPPNPTLIMIDVMRHV